MSFGAPKRLRRPKDFLRVKEQGFRRDCGAFIVQFLKILTPEEGPAVVRFGVIASRKVGGAVVRNRAKRMFREIFRTTQEELTGFPDIVVVVRRNFDKYSFSELKERYLRACNDFRKFTESQ